MKFLEFVPLYKERVWGGRWFEEKLGRNLPKSGKFGESWDIVDRDGDQSIVARGQWAGWTLRRVLEEAGEYIMGPEWDGERFPILVKWLDCRERLSLQVHPPKAVAEVLSGESKTENWYIAEAEGGANIFVGMKDRVDSKIFLEAVKSGRVEELLCEVLTRKGDSIFIPSGRLHAIGGGNLILEIQENSDTTYRVYDWGRVGLDGKARELHLKESLMSIDFKDLGSNVPKIEDNILVNCEEFRIRKLLFSPGETKILKKEEGVKILSVVDGDVMIIDNEAHREQLFCGMNVLIPYGESFNLEADKVCTILMTDQF